VIGASGAPHEVALSGTEPRRYRAGQSIQDLCRACKTTRTHTVIAADPDGRAARVMCDVCGSQHNFRDRGQDAKAASGGNRAPLSRAESPAYRLAGGPETKEHPMNAVESGDDLERRLRRLLREELGLTPGAPAEKWRGGELLLRPGKPGLQEKKWPIDTFFHKVVMIRNRLRTLEQQLNASELPEDAKLRLQAYVSGCYGTLTSFNVLFADEDEMFKGGSGD
jgi:hypothetical protein